MYSRKTGPGALIVGRMRQLRFVMRSEDGGTLLVETSDGTEQFALTLDAALRTAVSTTPPSAGIPTAFGGAAPNAISVAPTDSPGPTGATPAEPETPPIGPREIQVRVRSGEAPEELAASHGMTLERVMRFAGPVLDERRRIAGEARRARARRTATTEGAEPRLVQFGEAVDERFGAHGIDIAKITWDARRREDGEWLVIAEWLGGEATHSAEWLFHRSSRTVTPLDETATDLLSDRPIRPIAPEPARPRLVSAPPLAPGVVAFPPMPDAHTGPLPVVEEVFDQEAPAEGPRDIPPLVPPAAGIDVDVPTLPLGLIDPPARPGVGALQNLGVSRREESEEERAARARVPSWDDILLGIRRKE